MRFWISLGLLTTVIFCPLLMADEREANVTRKGKSYSVTVEVENDEVTQIHWPNGDDMDITGAKISEEQAVGKNKKGEKIYISLSEISGEKKDWDNL